MSEKRSEIQKRLTEIFCDIFDDDEIILRDEMTASDIEEWDSLMHITLIVAVEKEFGIRLIASEIGNLENVGAMLSLLEQRTNDSCIQ